MKSFTAFFFFCLSCLGVLSAQDKPNILIIYADDLGYGDVQCYNPEKGQIKTPHLDRLAAEGIRFTDGHSSSGVCSPSRYALLTGRYHWRSYLQRSIVGLWGKAAILPNRTTIGHIAKEKGYKTYCIGKWHLGWDWNIPADQKKYFQFSKKKPTEVTEEHLEAWREYFSKPIEGGPLSVGFDRYFGVDVPNWPPYCYIEDKKTIGIPVTILDPELLKNHQASKQGPALENWTLEPTLPALKDRVVQVIENQSEDSKPFMIYMPLTTPHTPLSVNEEWKGKSGLGLYGDLVMETDDIVGQVIKALKENGQYENTLIFFTSDNGCAHYIGVKDMEEKGHYASGPLRGYKSDVWEGGHRVPFIVSWPNVIKSPGVNHQLVHQTDIFSTIAEVIGYKIPDHAGEDSNSMMPLFHGENKPIREYAVSCSIKGTPAIRHNNWKLIFDAGSGGWTGGKSDEKLQLYNLEEDLSEQNNLYSKFPEKAKAMQAAMEKFITQGRSTPGEVQENDVKVIRYYK
jgi:arylsulfatase A-like enzyme